MAGAAVAQAAAQAAALAQLHAPEVTYQPKAAPARKRGAVIGSKPQLNAQGLLEQVQLNKEREDAQRAQVCSCPRFLVQLLTLVQGSLQRFVQQTDRVHRSWCVMVTWNARMRSARRLAIVTALLGV